MIEIPIPRYFKEDDRIPVDIKFLEEVVRDGVKKKRPKRGGGKGKKKKKAADDDDNEKKDEGMKVDEKL
jgi:hypothetical protein